MDYAELEKAYDEYLTAKAREYGVSVEEYLTDLLNNTGMELHTFEVAELIKGYGTTAGINAELAAEGLSDFEP